MTFDLEAMRRDRDAGTPGEWAAALERGCNGVIAASLPEGGANFVAMVGNDAESEEREPTRFANARRIARVPDMEDEIERLTAENERLRAKVEELTNPPEDYCATCGAPKSNHPYRHIFVSRRALSGEGST